MLVGHDWQYSWGGLVTNGDAFGDLFTKFWFDGYSAPQPPVSPPPVTGTPPGPNTPPSDEGSADADQGMTIDNGALYTNDPDVTLSIIAPNRARSLRVANDGGFLAAKTFPVGQSIHWRLAESGPERLPKTVYLRFGNDAQTFTDDIILDQTKPAVTAATVDGSGATATAATLAHAAASSGRTYRVQIRAKDATSGVAKVQFATSSKRHPTALRTFKQSTRVKGARAPRYVRVQDRAGNLSNWRAIR
jgi:hypothetical protein